MRPSVAIIILYQAICGRKEVRGGDWESEEPWSRSVTATPSSASTPPPGPTPLPQPEPATLAEFRVGQSSSANTPACTRPSAQPLSSPPSVARIVYLRTPGPDRLPSPLRYGCLPDKHLSQTLYLLVFCLLLFTFMNSF